MVDRIRKAEYMRATEYMLDMTENVSSTDNMCTVLEVVDFNVPFLRKLPEQPVINDMHKTNSQFRDKCDIKLLEHTTVLSSALHIVYQSKQNRVFVRPPPLGRGH